MTMPDIALGIFLGWFAIRIYLKLSGDWKKVEELLQKYFDAKETAIKAAKENT